MIRAQRGAALLAAMLTVMLVATLAAGALWQQWRAVEVESAERSRVQASWVLTGALDWARLILREDARAGGADYLAEPWAVPLQEARLSTFLAADRSASVDPASENAFLSGQITDAQSLLNVTDLVEAGRVSEPAARAFGRLFELLSLPQDQLNQMIEKLTLASDLNAGAQAPLLPQRVEQLVWLGLSPETVARLQPYVTVLPARTPVNLNTASAEVIYACLSQGDLAEAQRLVSARDSAYFRNVADAARLLPSQQNAFAAGLVGVASRFFEVRGRLRLGDVVVEELSLVQRDGIEVHTVQHQRGVFSSTAEQQLPISR